MAAERMTVNAKILSYLANRKGAAVTPEQIAIGTRTKIGTVSTQLPKLIDAGLVCRLREQKRNRSGRTEWAIVHADYLDGREQQCRNKPVPRADLERVAARLEAAANLVWTLVPIVPDMTEREREAMAELCQARDAYRDLMLRGIRPTTT